MKKLVIESDGSVYGTTITLDGEKIAPTSIAFTADVKRGVRCDVGFDKTKETVFSGPGALQVEVKLTELDVFNSVVQALKEVYDATEDTQLRDTIKRHLGAHFELS